MKLPMPLRRIPVHTTSRPHAARCRLGWHRVRFAPDATGVWVPRCTRCRGVACWWLAERNGATA